MNIPENARCSFYGIGEDKEAWANAQYLDPANYKPGEFEWWYVDGHLDNNVVFVATYHLEIKEDGSLFPYLTVNLTKGEEVISDVKIPVNPEEISFSKETCDVKLGNSFIKALDGLNKYELYIDPAQNEGNGLHLTIEKTVPTFSPRPRTEETPEKYFAWMCTVPSGIIEGTVTLNNIEESVKGIGYHDHNWGNVDMSELIDDWLWSRGEVDGYTTVAYSVRWKEGGEENSVFIAKGNDVKVAAAGPEVRLLEGAKKPNPTTGKPTTTDCIYFFETSDGDGSVRFKGETTIALFPFGEDEKTVWWYTRYNAMTAINMNIKGSAYDVKGQSTFEVMDFNGVIK